MEIWKKLHGDSDYLISSYGRVFSVNKNKFLLAYIHKSRSNYYQRIAIKKVKYMLHVLVAEHFLIDELNEMLKKYPREKLQVGQDKRNTLSVAADGLTWETVSENQKHNLESSQFIFEGQWYYGNNQARPEQKNFSEEISEEILQHVYS